MIPQSARPGQRQLRRLARRLGVGRTVLRLRHLRLVGVRNAARTRTMRQAYLPRILAASPVPLASSGQEVHVLLCQAELLRGLWALHSFFHHAGPEFSLLIHDDGTLTESDAIVLQEHFPGCRLIPRRESDRVVERHLADRGLVRCLQFRRRLFFALKLLDLCVYASQPDFIYFDSDVLFFASPNELLAGGPERPPRYMVDREYSYALPEHELERLLGRPCLQRCNAGFIRATLDLERVERYLAHDGFWLPDGTPHIFTDQTLYALEFTVLGAQPLPNSYVLAPPRVDDPGLVAAHFCGGPRSAVTYYTEALPRVAHLVLGKP